MIEFSIAYILFYLYKKWEFFLVAWILTIQLKWNITTITGIFVFKFVGTKEARLGTDQTRPWEKEGPFEQNQDKEKSSSLFFLIFLALLSPSFTLDKEIKEIDDKSCTYLYNIERRKERKKDSFLYLNVLSHVLIIFFNWERWLSGLKRRIANPLYELIVPRVRIPLFPLMTWFFFSNFEILCSYS